MTHGPFFSNDLKKTKDDKELGGLSSSSTSNEKNQEMMTSFPTCRHCLLQLRKNVKNDNKPQSLLLLSTTEAKQQKMMMSLHPNSSSSSAFEGKNQEMMMSREAHCHLLHLKKNQEMMMSWEAPGSSSSFAIEKKTKK